MVEFEEEFGEKRVGLFNSKNDAINEAKNLIWAIGRGDKSTFSYNAYWKVWTNDPSGMQDGSYSIRKVEWYELESRDNKWNGSKIKKKKDTQFYPNGY